jgi:hypothetical protein
LTELRLYRLQGTQPMREPNVAVWASWMEAALPRLKVALTVVEGAIVATSFVGIDPRAPKQIKARSKPHVWSSMVTAARQSALEHYDGWTITYTSKVLAARGHQELVDLLKGIARRARANGNGPC